MTFARTLTLSTLALATSAAFAAEPVIGLITKTESNPFFVKMKEGADAEAKKLGAKLLSAAGKTDGDNAGQVTACLLYTSPRGVVVVAWRDLVLHCLLYTSRCV